MQKGPKCIQGSREDILEPNGIALRLCYDRIKKNMHLAHLRGDIVIHALARPTDAVRPTLIFFLIK